MARKKRKTNDPSDTGGETAVAVEEEELTDFEAVLDQDPNGLLVVEPESRQVLWANRSAEKMLKKKREKLLTEPFPEELEEGPMRTLDLNRKISSLSWQGQEATMLVLTEISTNSASFSTEWRLEAAEERAREAEEQVTQLQGLLQEARKSAKAAGGGDPKEAADLKEQLAKAEERATEAEALLEAASQTESKLKAELLKSEERAQAAESLLDEVSAGGNELQALKAHEAELQAELVGAQDRLATVEQELRAVESRVDLAEQRAREAEQLMEEAESQSRETERHLEDVQDSVHQVEEQLEQTKAELNQTRAELAAERKSREQSGAESRIADLAEQVDILREELESARGRLTGWEEKQAQWSTRESEIEELEGVHLQVITELEQLREERQNWQEAQAKQTVEPGELENLQEQLRESQERVDFLEVERSELEEKWLEARAELETAQRHSADLEASAELTGAQHSEAQAEMLSRLEQLSAELEAAKDSQSGEADELKMQLVTAQEQLGELSAQLSAAQDECTTVQVELATAQEHWAESQSQVQEAQTNLLQAQAQIQDIQAQLAEALAQTSEVQGQLGEAQSELGSLRAELESLKQADGQEKALSQQLEEQLAELQLESADLNEKNTDLLLQLSESESKAQSAVEELALARQELEKLTTVSGEFEDVQQHLVSVEKERDELLRHLDETEVELEKVRSQLEEKTAEAEAQSAALSDLESQLNDTIDAAEEARKRPSAETEALKANVVAGEERARLLQEQLDEMLERVELADKLETELFLLRGAADEQSSRLKELEAVHQARVSELEELLAEAQLPNPQALEDAEARIAAEERIAELEAALAGAQQPDPQLAAHEARLQELEAALAASQEALAVAQEALAGAQGPDPNLALSEEARAAAEERMAALEAELATSQEELAAAREALAQAQTPDPRLAEQEQMLSEAEALVAEQEAATAAAQNARATAEARVAELESALAASESALAASESALAVAQSAPVGDDTQSRIAELEAALSNSESALIAAESALATAQSAAAPAAESDSRIEELEAALAEAQGSGSQLGELEAAFTQYKADAEVRVTELEELLEQASHFEPEVARLKQELAAAQSAVGAPDSHTADLETALSDSQDALSAAQQALATSEAALAEAQPKLMELEAEILRLQQATPEPSADGARMIELEAEVHRLQAELDGARASDSSGEVAALQTELAGLKQAQAMAAPAGEAGNKETEQLAFEDNLTRLPNLNLLKRYMGFSLKQVERYDRKCALVHVDLDRFTALNEALGPEAGDEVLRQVGERLQKVVRTSDVLCRKSEDDFLILLTEVAGEAEAPQSISIVLKRIQEVLSPPMIAGNQPVLITASLGVSQFPSDAEDGDKMLVHAYEAMRRAKELGRNQVQFYTDELQKRHEARATLEAELRKGVEARQFQLLYQPIVHLATGAIKGVESLLRWAHPSYGVLTPDYFLEVADETGVMVPLGRWVILEAAKQLYEWSRQGLDLFVTVNLSTRQFLQADLVDTIRRALESTGAPAHNFVVEVPESVQMLDIQRVQAILLALRQAGVRVALDRFGSGFSSLERIHSELTTLIKVDRKFLFHSASNAAALNVTAAAMALARVLRVRPVAVGVENAAQLSLCRQLECEYVQGNLVYIPTDATQISELARAGRLLR